MSNAGTRRKRRGKQVIGGVSRKRYAVTAVVSRTLPEKKKLGSRLKPMLKHKPKEKKVKQEQKQKRQKEQYLRRVTGISRKTFRVADILRKKKKKRRIPFQKTAQRVRAFAGRHPTGLQTAGIALLTVTLLGSSTYLWSQVLDADSVPKDSLTAAVVERFSHSGNENAEVFGPAAYPVRMAVRGENGLYGVEYSVLGIRAAYEQTEEMLSRALNSVKRLEPSVEQEYAKALTDEMVFLEFEGSIPVRLLFGWLDADAPKDAGERVCSAMLLSQQATGECRLYLRDSESGEYLTAETSIGQAEFESTVNLFRTNGCTIAAEQEHSSISPDTLRFPQQHRVNTLSIRPYEGSVSGLLHVFGISSDAAVYESKDGDKRYAADGASVRAANDLLTYDSDSGLRISGGSSSKGESVCTRAGQQMSQRLLESMNSNGEVHLTKSYTDKDGSLVAVYGLRVDGVPVDNELGYFSRLVFSDGVLHHADVVLRVCSITGTVETVMPQEIAASIRTDGTALLSLRYTDTAPLKEESRNSLRMGEEKGLLSSSHPVKDDSWVSEAAERTGGWMSGGGSTAAQDGGSFLDSEIEIINAAEQPMTPMLPSAAGISDVNDVVYAAAQWKFLVFDNEGGADR